MAVPAVPRTPRSRLAGRVRRVLLGLFPARAADTRHRRQMLRRATAVPRMRRGHISRVQPWLYQLFPVRRAAASSPNKRDQGIYVVSG